MRPPELRLQPRRAQSRSGPSISSRLMRASDRLFAWMYPIFETHTDEFIASAGLDAYMFSRVMQFGIEVFGFTSLLCLSVVIPTNLAGNVVSQNHVKKTGNANNFTRYTMGNIENGSDLFYVHFVAVYMIVLWTLFCMRRLFREYIILRRRFLSKVNGAYSPHSRSAVHPAPPETAWEPPEVNGHEPADGEKENGGVPFDVFDDDSLFYDDCVVVDRSSGNEVVINNLHRYVVLLRNVPRSFNGRDTARHHREGETGPRSDVSLVSLGSSLSGKARSLLQSFASLFFVDMGGSEHDIGRRESLLSEDEDERDEQDDPGKLERGQPDAGAGDGRPDVVAVRRKLERVFPGDSVADVVPVYDGRRADVLMMERHRLRDRLRGLRRRGQRAAMPSYENLESEGGDDEGDEDGKVTESMLPRCSCIPFCPVARGADGKRLSERIDVLTREIHFERRAARSLAASGQDSGGGGGGSVPSSSMSYFVIFRDQKSAMMARQMLLFENATLGSKFSVEPAPAPTDVIYDSIINSEAGARGSRVLLSSLLVGALVILPVGALASGISTLSVLLCSQYHHHADDPSPVFSHSIAEMWCVDLPADARAVVTGVVPSLIISIYGGTLLPRLLYCLALCESFAVAKADVDKRIASWYWIWAVVNVFFSSLAGGSVLSQVNVALENPEAIPRLIGTAIPKFSNFFINYVSFQALVSNGLMLLLPSGVLGSLWRRCSRGESARRRLRPQSVRYGRECGITMLVFLIGISYCVQSPLIAPAALAYFIGGWAAWRYLSLFVYIRSYESCGEMVFTYTRRAVFHSLKIMITLMALLFLIYTRWSLGVLLLVSLLPVVHVAGEEMQRRLARLADDGVPLETIVRREGGGEAPVSVAVPSELYVPPSLRSNGAGWSPHQGMAWVNWDCPRHCP